MRRLVQPGPVHPVRIDSIESCCEAVQYELAAGATLNEALTAPLVSAGFRSAAIAFSDALLSPFAYVIPGRAVNTPHVAYFSATRSPLHGRVSVANATFGWRDGKPFVHCHGLWIEPDGAERGGHVLPHDTVLVAPALARAWALRDVAIEVDPDPETNFPLFHPVRRGGAPSGEARCVVARVKPNEDICLALEAICASHGIADSVVCGSLGSLHGLRFDDGRNAEDIATEVLVLDGHVTGGQARVELAAVDMQGAVHRGTLARGDNPVCITFEVMLAEASRGQPPR